MYLRPFEYIVTLAELKSFSKAANALYISQPSLSQYISNFEEKLGLLLIERTTTHFELTYAGELFVEAARRILDLEDGLMRQFEDIKGLKKGRVCLGIPRHRGSLILPSILPAFYKKYPGIEVALTEGSSAELEELTVQGKTDVTIINLPVSSDQLVYETLTNEEVLVIVPPHHPLKERISEFPQNFLNLPVIQLSELRDNYFILRRNGTRLRQVTNELFLQAGFTPKVRLESSSMQTIKNLVATGVGVSFVVDTWVEAPPTPLFFSLGNPQKTTLQLVAMYREGKYLSRATRAFIDVAKEVLNKAEE